MWGNSYSSSQKHNIVTKGGTGNGLVAVAIGKDKGSQHALKWAADSLITRGQTVILIHVSQKPSSNDSAGGNQAFLGNLSNISSSPQTQYIEKSIKDLFLTCHCYCTRKDIQCLDVLLEDADVVKAITDYAAHAAIENLVLGAAQKHGFIRFKTSSVSSSVTKAAPDFCTVYIISKGKISSVRSASRQVPFTSPLLNRLQDLNKQNVNQFDVPSRRMKFRNRASMKNNCWQDKSIKSPFTRGLGLSRRSLGDYDESGIDISFVSSDRPSTDRYSSVMFDYLDSGRNSRTSIGSERCSVSNRLRVKYADYSSSDLSSISHDSSRTSFSYSSNNMDEVESEMRRLKLELKQTMDMYGKACREALAAQQKAMELQQRRLEEEKRLENTRLSQEAAVAMAEKEKTRYKAELEAAEAAKKIEEVETHKKSINLEMSAMKEVEEARSLLSNLTQNDARYRRYSIEEIEEATESFAQSQKIGEGGYGPVFKCCLDHTQAAVKVLRPDAVQGRAQFQQEVDILSCIRHPNMVLLLGACPEYGILIYEYMANGSLDDCLFRKGNTPPLSWQLRFRIAAEIATGLLFLHQTKPEPLVHRDLKPGNILLDQNFVSKIGDVGLAKLVPAVAENVTQCRMTSAAGTFCYIDPEYQQTGMLGVKSDVYSLGILLLQVVTGRPPVGLAHHAAQALEKGTLADLLDPCVPDWPVEKALTLAKMALRCGEFRRKDRPDLRKEVLPELIKLKEFAEASMNHMLLVGGHVVGTVPSQACSQTSIQQDVMNDPHLEHSGTSISQSST